jgi:hypothetical protein
MEQAARAIVGRHRERDEHERQGPLAQPEEKKLATYRAKITKIKRFLASAKKNLGPNGNERKSNITDPESAKMSTTHGVIQGYNGVAVVDDHHQIVVHAEARGEGQENHLFEPMVVATHETLTAIGCAPKVVRKARFTADSGYHSRPTLQFVAHSGVDAYVADPQRRRRDPAFTQAGRYKERHRKERRRRGDAAQARHTAGAGHLRAPDRHGGAGVREPPEQGHAPLHAAWPAQGGRAMEAVHAGAQHREDRTRSGRLTRAMGNKVVPETSLLDPTDRARVLRPASSPAQPFARCHRVFLQSR